MPKAALNASQIMTTGAKNPAIFVVPRGWIRKSTMRMPHVVPTTVDLVMSGFTTMRPWTAPRMDWAGVRTPSHMTIDTASTPIVFKRALAIPLRSRRERTVRLAGLRSPV